MPPAQSPQHAPKPLEPGGGGRFFRQLLFSLIPLSLALVAAVTAEGVLRLALPDLKRAYAAPLDPEKGYGITLGHRFSLNSLGLREAEFPIEPPRGQTRVLCLGDSVTFGYGLPYESTWPKILENLLRQSHPGRDIFCINAAGNAATTHEALSVYRATMRSFGARVVVLGFCMNDVRVKRHANDLRSVGLSRRGRGLLAWRYELRRSYLFSAIDLTVTEGVKRYLYPLAGRSWLMSYPYQLNSLGMTEVAETAWHDTLHSLGQLHREVSAHGARLIVAAFPYQFQISSDARDNPYRIDEADFRIGPFDRLGRFCERNSIPFVSLLAGFGDGAPRDDCGPPAVG